MDAWQGDGVCPEGGGREKETWGSGEGPFSWDQWSASEGNYVQSHTLTQIHKEHYKW